MDRRNVLKGLAAAGAALAARAAPAAAKGHPVPADAVGLLYDATLCVGCQACMVACREESGLPYENGSELYDAPRDLSSRTRTIVKQYQSADEHSFVKVQCMHCVDPACVSACMLGALEKREHGIVSWDGDLCVGCRYCQIACPFEVPKFEWDSANPSIVKCELCRDRIAEGKIPACAEVCPRKAITYGPRRDLLIEARRRIAAEPERYIPKVYGEHEGGGTQMLYLSGVPFENLGLPKLGEGAVPDMVRGVQGTIYKGFIAPVLLYGAMGIAIIRNRRNGSHDDEA